MAAHISHEDHEPEPRGNDRCTFSRSFSPSFSENPACPAFQGAAAAVTDTAGNLLDPTITCRHLTAGRRTDRWGRFYPRCGLGAPADRVTWLAAVTPGRLAVMRSLEEELAVLACANRARLLEAKARLLAGGGWDAGAVEDLEVELSEFLDDADALIRARSDRLDDVGLATGPLTQLLHDWSLAWLRSRRLFAPALHELPLDGFVSTVTGFLGAEPGTDAGAGAETVAVAGRLEVERSDSPPGLRLRGDIDVTNADVLATALADLPGDGGELTIDFGAVTFCDVGGLRAVVTAAAKVGAGRRMVVAGLPAHLQRAMEIAGWADLPQLVVGEGGARAR